ncbi:hypothetical protein GCM10007989_10680 [Devosia pacifica]|uniref:DUF4214 domain-containing protein n=1 Tax=Devosia pacifica TaxID=1335967 RepID=A0A918RZU6_9HYPH|nr:DUF4214 domain-containing protein [Devosia pacifica]GHA17354.1 hypothetical protein GCM10007989_10680 [Devosia pacifica]
MAYETRQFSTVRPGSQNQIFYEDLGYGNNTDDRFVIPTSGLSSFNLTINDDQLANNDANYASALIVRVYGQSFFEEYAYVDFTNASFSDAAYELADYYADRGFIVYDDETDFELRISPRSGETVTVDIAGALYDNAGQLYGGSAEPISYTVAISDIQGSGGGGGGGIVSGDNGNNFVYFAQVGEYYDGEGGRDTVYFQQQSGSYSIDVQNTNTVVVNGVSLFDVERLDFANGTLALDINGSAGYMYRLYQAAFGRDPDIDGLSFYVEATDNGQSLIRSAAIFIDSPEFRELYGTNLPDDAFINELYFNVLDRGADQSGLNYWNQQMDNGMSRAEVLARFADSPENRQQVLPEIDDGIWLN